MMKYSICLGFLVFCVTASLAQKEDYVWMLGFDQSLEPGIQGMVWDWNAEHPVPISRNLAYGVGDYNISICDPEGNLLFWSNGCAVMNRNQEVMPHGDTLNWDAYREIIPGRDVCLRGYVGIQNVKIIPDPAYDQGYYIFHKAFRYPGQFDPSYIDLRLSYVDMSLDEGLGDVVFYDSILYDRPFTNANLEVIRTSDDDGSWWLLQPIEDDSLILTLKVDQTGIHEQDRQAAGFVFAQNRAGGGTMRISPDGQKMAYYDYFQNLHIYDFDRATGQISNHQKVTIFDDAEDKPDNQFRFGSVEWSPSSRFMYVAVRDSLFQVDSWEEDMNDGIRLIDVWNGMLDPFPTSFYVATLAPDCKIYICSGSGLRTYHVIHQPDALGTACDFVQNGFELPQDASGGDLPLHPRWRVDEEDKCDPTITSVFGQAVWYRRDLDVYPSPSSGPLTVGLPEHAGAGQLLVINAEGQVVIEHQLSQLVATHHLDLSDYPVGTYHVEFYPEDRGEQVYYGQQIVIIR